MILLSWATLADCGQAWYDASAASLAHLFGARSLFQAWLKDEALCSHHDEPSVLDRQQSFLVGAMVYLECLASFIHDQTFDDLAYLRRFGTFADGQRVYPNPWTGVSTPLFLHLAETAIIMRFKRIITASPPGVNTGRHSDIAKTAKLLYRRTSIYKQPATTNMEGTKDAKTPLAHLVNMDSIFRLVILMELIQTFPELAFEEDLEAGLTTQKVFEARGIVVDFAIAILSIVSRLPESSGANEMLSIPLIAAGSALQTPGTPADQGCGVGHTNTARIVISTVMHDRESLQSWREQTQLRLQRTYDLIGLAPLQLANQLVKEVWRRADLIDNSGHRSAAHMVHWMDIMIEEKLETLFG
jgi:hypothetical protein